MKLTITSISSADYRGWETESKKRKNRRVERQSRVRREQSQRKENETQTVRRYSSIIAAC